MLFKKSNLESVITPALPVLLLK